MRAIEIAEDRPLRAETLNGIANFAGKQKFPVDRPIATRAVLTERGEEAAAATYELRKLRAADAGWDSCIVQYNELSLVEICFGRSITSNRPDVKGGMVSDA